MSRKRYVWDPEAPDPWGGKGAMVEVCQDFQQPTDLHYVIPDCPDYTSPVTGKLVSGRKQRRDDLARTGSRPWEGQEQEMKEAARRRQYAEQRTERKLDEAAHRAYYQIDPRKRRALGGD